MKKIKKLLGIVLALALVINISFGLTCTKVDAASNVAYVWIASCTSGTTGHAFIAVKNVSSTNIVVGLRPLGPGKIVTLGTYGNLEDGQCLYYNVEKYCMNDSNANNNYTPNKYIGEYITSSELSTLNSTINSHTSWSLSYNCAGFAADCWNSFSDRTLSANSFFIANQYYWSPVTLPSYLAINIEQQSSYSTNLSISGSCSSGEVYYQPTSTSYGTASLDTIDLLTSSSESIGS